MLQLLYMAPIVSRLICRNLQFMDAFVEKEICLAPVNCEFLHVVLLPGLNTSKYQRQDHEARKPDRVIESRVLTFQLPVILSKS